MASVSSRIKQLVWLPSQLTHPGAYISRSGCFGADNNSRWTNQLLTPCTGWPAFTQIISYNLYSLNYHSTDVQKVKGSIYNIIVSTVSLQPSGFTLPCPSTHASPSLGSSESRRLFQKSMKKGYVDMFTDKMLLYGSAGVGKTCTMKIVASEKPPDIQNSTPVAIKVPFNCLGVSVRNG